MLLLDVLQGAGERKDRKGVWVLPHCHILEPFLDQHVVPGLQTGV